MLLRRGVDVKSLRCVNYRPLLVERRWLHDGSRSQKTARQSSRASKQSTTQSSKTSTDKLSLADQLFPTIHKHIASDDAKALHQKPREVPPLPFDTSDAQIRRARRRDHGRHIEKRRLYEDAPSSQTDPLKQQRSGELTSVLRIANASKNLSIADFQRLIPKTQRLDGWALAATDIIKVVPGRNLQDISQQPSYLLVFRNPLSAHRFRAHVRTMQSLAQKYTPRYPRTEWPVTPDEREHGLNIADSIRTFAVAAPDQTFMIEHLTAPLSNITLGMVKHGGLEVLFARPDRKPFELRLTLQGRQVSSKMLRKVFVTSGHDRGAPWSGDPNHNFSFLEWEATSFNLGEWVREKKRSKEVNPDVEKKWKTRDPVYVIGFDTEDAAQSFLHYWHMRPLTAGNNSINLGYLDDIPAIVKLETLW